MIIEILVIIAALISIFVILRTYSLVQKSIEESAKNFDDRTNQMFSKADSILNKGTGLCEAAEEFFQNKENRQKAEEVCIKILAESIAQGIRKNADKKSSS
jgi:hypothetical protein